MFLSVFFPFLVFISPFFNIYLLWLGSIAKLLSEEKSEEKTCNMNNQNTPQHKLRGDKAYSLKKQSN